MTKLNRYQKRIRHWRRKYELSQRMYKALELSTVNILANELKLADKLNRKNIFYRVWCWFKKIINKGGDIK